MSTPNTTAREVRFAVSLLRYLHANSNNVYLLLAVIAWVRSESGQTYLGNNPLNIRNSPYASGYRQTAKNGRFAIFKDLDVAAKATAAFLNNNKGNGYDVILAASRHAALTAKDQQTQAIDFFLAVVQSKWDLGHYGLTAAQLKDPNAIYTTALYKLWTSLLGHPVNIPADPVKVPKPPPAPRQPRTLQHTVPVRDYLQPYAADAFYEARYKPDANLPGTSPDDESVR